MDKPKKGVKRMLSDFFEPLAPFIYIGIAILYVLLIRQLDRLEYRYKKAKGKLTDEQCMARLATILGISEYDIFKKALENWNISEIRMKDDFSQYLQTGLVPHYVRDLLRRHRKEIDAGHSGKFPFNDSLPPSWSA